MLTSSSRIHWSKCSLISPEPADETQCDAPGQLDLRTGTDRRPDHRRGQRWADAWTDWEGYDKLFSQLVRWSMRPTGDQGNFTVATEIEDGKVRVIVTALDQNDELLNFLNMSASVVGPDMKAQSFPIRQTAPGSLRRSNSTASRPGSYFLTLATGRGQAAFSGPASTCRIRPNSAIAKRTSNCWSNSPRATPGRRAGHS